MYLNAKRAITEGLRHEGGYVNHPGDPGGATNKGITIATFRRYIKPGGTIADLKALTTDQAIIVYKRRYWDAVLGDMLPSGVDFAVYDFAINSGPSRAAKYLQKVVEVKQDGKIGPATLAAAEYWPTDAIINAICDERLAFMKRIKNRKTGKRLWLTFGTGWGRRVASVRQVSLDMALDIKLHNALVSLDAKPPIVDKSNKLAQGKPTSGIATWLAKFLKSKGFKQ